MENGENGAGNTRPPGRKIRLALSIFRYFSRGGAQRELFNIAREMAARNWEVTIFCIDWEPAESEDFSGITVRELPVSGTARHRKARKFDSLLKQILQEEKFDLHFAFSRVSGADWYFSEDLPLGRRKVKSNWLSKLMPQFRTFSALEDAVFGSDSATKIMYLVPMQLQVYQRFYNTSTGRMFQLPPGIDRSFAEAGAKREVLRREMRERLQLADDEIMLLTINSSCRSSGIDRVAAAVGALPEEIRSNVKLFIAGKDENDEISTLAENFCISEQTEFLGWRDDVMALMAAADLLVYPARSDVASAVLLEAAACGLPVICSGNCGFSGIVAESGGEVLPLPFRQSVLNRSLRMLLTTPEQLVELHGAVADYSGNADFYSRTAAMAALLESDVKDRIL